MNIKQLLLIFILLGYGINAQSQVSAFVNFQNQFMVWEDGMIRKIEYLVPTIYKKGRIAMPYIDNSRSFKIYYNGGSTKINDGYTSSFQVSDNLITFQNATALFVWEKGEITKLSNMSSQYYTGDSIVIFFDGVQRMFNAYYDHKIYPIEGFLAGTNTTSLFDTDSNAVISADADISSGALPSVKASDNIAAYVNYASQFRIFYRGEIIEEEEYLVTNFGVGRNTVAYINANREFKIFQNGKTRVIDNFPPYSYSVGDNVVAYVGFDNYFKIYYNDSIYNIGYFEPRYQIADNVVAFEDATGYFKVFYKGNIYTLETFYPEHMKIKYNSLAYVNRTGMLRMFSDGQVYDVTNAEITNWMLDYDVLQYRFGSNMNKIFYKGKTY